MVDSVYHKERENLVRMASLSPCSLKGSILLHYVFGRQGSGREARKYNDDTLFPLLPHPWPCFFDI